MAEQLDTLRSLKLDQDTDSLFNRWFYDGKEFDEDEHTRIKTAFREGVRDDWLDAQHAVSISRTLKRIEETCDMYKLLGAQDVSDSDSD